MVALPKSNRSAAGGGAGAGAKITGGAATGGEATGGKDLCAILRAADGGTCDMGTAVETFSAEPPADGAPSSGP